MTRDIKRNETSLIEDLEILCKRVNRLEQRTEQHTNSEKLQPALYRIADTADSSRRVLSFYAILRGIITSLIVAKSFFTTVLDRDRENVYFSYYKNIKEPLMS